MSEDPRLQHAVRRTVGIAALRRMRRVVDADEALEANKSRWAKRLSLLFIAATVMALVWITFR